MSKILRVIDSVNKQAGSISSWLVAILIVLILYEVIARYVFNSPTTWGFNTLRMLGSAIIVMSWAYAQRHNSHIRVDVFYTGLSPRQKALIDVIGTGIFLVHPDNRKTEQGGVMKIARFQWQDKVNWSILEGDSIFVLDGDLYGDFRRSKEMCQR